MAGPEPAPEPTLDEATAASLLPERDPRGHKGTFGRLAVVAGSLDYAGAALMAGAAALRAGCGLVTLHVPASLQPVIAGRIPELITSALPESAPGEVDGPEAAAQVRDSGHDALLIGPGLRPGRGTSRMVLSLLGEGESPAVVDAGALGALATTASWPDRIGRRCVLTPHPGEFRALGPDVGPEDEARLVAARDAAVAWSQVVVLKGARTVLAAPDGRLLVAPFQLPALASAGSGDVLAGIIASLLAQGLETFEAASLGVYLHGRAGVHVSEILGDAGLMATDLLGEIPRVRRHLRSVQERLAGSRLGFEAPGPSGP